MDIHAKDCEPGTCTFACKEAAMDELRGFCKLLVENELKHIETADIEAAIAVLNLGFNRACRLHLGDDACDAHLQVVHVAVLVQRRLQMLEASGRD